MSSVHLNPNRQPHHCPEEEVQQMAKHQHLDLASCRGDDRRRSLWRGYRGCHIRADGGRARNADRRSGCLVRDQAFVPASPVGSVRAMLYLGALGLGVLLMLLGLFCRYRSGLEIDSAYTSKLVWVSLGLGMALGTLVFPALWLFVSLSLHGGRIEDTLPPGTNVRFLPVILLVGTSMTVVYTCFGYRDHVFPYTLVGPDPSSPPIELKGGGSDRSLSGRMRPLGSVVFAASSCCPEASRAARTSSAYSINPRSLNTFSATRSPSNAAGTPA